MLYCFFFFFYYCFLATNFFLSLLFLFYLSFITLSINLLNLYAKLVWHLFYRNLSDNRWVNSVSRYNAKIWTLYWLNFRQIYSLSNEHLKCIQIACLFLAGEHEPKHLSAIFVPWFDLGSICPRVDSDQWGTQAFSINRAELIQA